jgi:Amt family ammonium transporter
MRRLVGFLLIIVFLCLTGVVSGEVQPSHTGEAPTITSSKIDSGDTAWILVSTALVMLMTPGLALFYGGMVRGKNVLGTIMQNFFAIAACSGY